MRKLMLAALGLASIAPGLAHAQDAQLDRDRLNLHRQERQYQDARAYGDRGDVRHEARDVRNAEQDYRADWQDYRRSHQGEFRRPAYVGPAGYAYRPIVQGYRLQPVYFSPRYRVEQWRRWHLPPPALYTGYVRYGNDVALVDLRSGVVIRVFNGFFY